MVYKTFVLYRFNSYFRKEIKQFLFKIAQREAIQIINLEPEAFLFQSCGDPAAARPVVSNGDVPFEVEFNRRMFLEKSRKQKIPKYRNSRRQRTCSPISPTNTSSTSSIC